MRLQKMLTNHDLELSVIFRPVVNENPVVGGYVLAAEGLKQWFYRKFPGQRTGRIFRHKPMGEALPAPPFESVLMRSHLLRNFFAPGVGHRHGNGDVGFLCARLVVGFHQPQWTRI